MIFFSLQTTATINFIVVKFPSGFDTSEATKLIERSGIGPGSLTLLPAPTPEESLIVYEVNNPVSIPGGTEIRLDIGTIVNSNTAGSFQVVVGTFDSSPALIDASLSPSFAIKDITGADVSPNFMIRKTLKDDSAGNAKNWNPDDVTTRFGIVDSDIIGNKDSVFVTINTQNAASEIVCHVNGINPSSPGLFGVVCNVPPNNGAELHYQIFKLPPHAIVSSSSSSPFASLQDSEENTRGSQSSPSMP